MCYKCRNGYRYFNKPVITILKYIVEMYHWFIHTVGVSRSIVAVPIILIRPITTSFSLGVNGSCSLETVLGDMMELSPAARLPSSLANAMALLKP